MNKMRYISLVILIFTNSVLISGCWNYREVNDLAIVAGAAIDKGENGQFKLTVEIIEISGGTNAELSPRIITTQGKTLFEAARNMIAITGKRLYWSHTKVIIISQEIASEGLAKIVKWYTRDAETREDVKLLISGAESAQEIFNAEVPTGKIMSITLEQVLNNQTSLGKAPIIDILQYDNELMTKRIVSVVPMVNLIKINEKMMPEVKGSAIIKHDKLGGFLDDLETQDLIFVRDKIEGGILVVEMKTNNEDSLLALEIFGNKTKIKPQVNNNEITINVDIESRVALDELICPAEIVKTLELKNIEKATGEMLKMRIESLIEKMQTEYSADIFGFGEALWQNDPQAFLKVVGNNDWEEPFKHLQVKVNTKIHVINSALLAKGIGEGD